MFGSGRDELEARVARLERLLDRVLVLIREIQGEGKADETSPERAVAEGEGASLAALTLEGSGPPEVAREGASGQGGEATATGSAREGPVPSTPFPTRGAASVAPVETKARAHRWEMGGATWLDEIVNRALSVPKGTLLGRVGIVLLLLSVAYFFKYSIDQGWLTEWVRLAIGVGVGATLCALGFKGAGKGEPLGTVLAGGGIATFFITGFVGHQWFHLVSYPVAFGFLVAASGFGVLLALRSGLQALGIVGLIGALGTPLLLTSPSPEVVGLALYVSLIVASVAAIYLVRAWRALFLLAVITAWLVLSPAVGLAAETTGTEPWVVQGAIAFCALVFWVAPLLRAGLRARNPARWPRPEAAFTPWKTHLDALSLLMPLVGILMSMWLWGLSFPDLEWLFFGTALLALGLGWWISRTEDPEGCASTQRFVAILLFTVGLGLALEGDVLYLAFIAEAVALLTLGSRKKDLGLTGLGGAVQLVVVGLFLFRLGVGGTLLEGDLSSVFDLAAIVGAVFLGTQVGHGTARRGFLAGAYVGFLAFLGRELGGHQSALYLAFILTAVVTQAGAFFRKSPLFSTLGHLPVLVFGSMFLSRMHSDASLWAGDATSWIDLAAVVGAAYVGTLLNGRQGRQLYLYGAYLGLLAWTARELYPVQQGQAFMSLAFGIEGTVLLVAGLMTNRGVLQKTGMATLLLVVVKVLAVDLAAVEPIWRVFLLFVFAVLFLLLSKFVQGRRQHRLDGQGMDAAEGIGSSPGG